MMSIVCSFMCVFVCAKTYPAQWKPIHGLVVLPEKKKTLCWLLAKIIWRQTVDIYYVYKNWTGIFGDNSVSLHWFANFFTVINVMKNAKRSYVSIEFFF